MEDRKLLIHCSTVSIVCFDNTTNMWFVVHWHVGVWNALIGKYTIVLLLHHQNIYSKQEMCLEAHLAEQDKMNW